MSEEVKRAAEDVLKGNVDNPIGDAYYFFGRKNGYDLWVEADKASYVKEIGGNVFYTDFGTVHNKMPLSDQQKASDNIIIIYDAEKGDWQYHGEIIVDGEVVVDNGTK